MTESSGAKRKSSRLNSYPFYSPRFWHGMRLRHWLHLYLPNFFRIHPLRIAMALIVTVIATINSLLFRIQRKKYGHLIEQTRIEKPPIFIIGHWRSGTTYLHELLVRDDRFGFPTTYECFAPSHFLVSSGTLPKLVRFLLPSKRPMDNMPTGLEHPQEDEFALCALGAPTPYLRMAFPNDPPPYLEFLDMEGTRDEDLAKWKDAFVYFVKALTLRKKKQIVLKSPPHTGRIAVLRELFPGAKFVHIVRNPFAIFPSTQRLWKALDAAQAFQMPHHRNLDEYVFTAFERMYNGFRTQSSALTAGGDASQSANLCEVRYEDVVADPVGQVRRIYEQLQLGDFEHVEPELKKFAQSQKDYNPNQHDLDEHLQQQIRQRWSWYFEKYGYG